jgi:hypothetical protein
MVTAQYFNNVYDQVNVNGESSTSVIIDNEGLYLVPFSYVNDTGYVHGWRKLDNLGIEISVVELIDTPLIMYLNYRESFQVAFDGGYLNATPFSQGGVAKYAASGTLEWLVTVDSLNAGTTALKQLASNDIVFVAKRLGDTTSTVVWCNSDGLINYDVLIDIPQEHHFFRFESIRELSNGDLLFAGFLTNNQPWINDWGVEESIGNNADQLIVRTDSLGNLIWSKNWDGDFQDNIPQLVENVQNSTIVATTSNILWHEQNDDHWPYIAQMGTMLVNINTGDTSEVKYVGDLLLSSYSIDIVETPDGGYAILGMALTYNSYLQYSFIMKLDSEREMDWYKTYNYEDISVDSSYIAFTYDIAVTPDSGFIVVGERRDTWTDGNNKQMPWIFKTDQCGELEWNNCGADNTHEFNDSNIQRFKIAPNPVSDVVSISSEQPIQSIIVRDITGKIVLVAAQLSNLQARVDVSTLAKGLYLVEVDFGGGVIGAQKLVVE